MSQLLCHYIRLCDEKSCFIHRAVVSDLSSTVGIIQSMLKARTRRADGMQETGASTCEMKMSEAESFAIFDLHLLRTVIHNSSVQKVSSSAVQVWNFNFC